MNEMRSRARCHADHGRFLPAVTARVWIVLAALWASSFASAIDVSKLQPSGYVNDFAGVIDAANKRSIEDFAANLERAAGVQLAVVTIDSLDGDAVEDVATKLYGQWGIGKKTGVNRDEGALILLSIKDRKNRIEVGYGLEPIITDATAGTILRSIRPILRNGDYGAALLAASQQLGQQIAQSKGIDLGIPGAPVATRTEPRGHGIPGWMIVAFIVIFIILSNRGNRGGGYPGGGGGFLPGLILGNMMGRRGGWGGSDWGGGGFGGGSSGGGGFGGFGGGSSGGGGASSDW